MSTNPRTFPVKKRVIEALKIANANGYNRNKQLNMNKRIQTQPHIYNFWNTINNIIAY